MRNFFGLLVVTFLSVWAGAQEGPTYNGFRCIPSLKQTRLQVMVREKTVEMTVVNPAGYLFMPQFDGSGTAYGLSFQKMQAEDLKDLGDSFTITWDKEKCAVDLNQISINCGGEAIEPIGSIKSYGISTARITEEYDHGVYKKRRFRFTAENQNTYFVNLEFYLQNCAKFN